MKNHQIQKSFNNEPWKAPVEMFKYKILSIFLIFCFILKVSSEEDEEENFCDPNLCDDGISHIACDHYLEFSKECGDEPELIELKEKDIKLILDLHNHYRNLVASGMLSGYAPAVRMPIIVSVK